MEKKKKGFVAEFREFINRGNVLDLAVGVIIAAAFGKITTSLVGDVVMPLIGSLIGGIDLTSLNITLREAVMAGETVVTEAVVIGIGSFLATVLDFLLVALVVFFIVRTFNRAKELAVRQKVEAPAEPPKEPAPTTEALLAEILGEIKKK